MSFQLDPRLAASSLELGHLGSCRVLLKNNAHFVWILLVPEVDSVITELHDLPPDLYREVCSHLRSLSEWLKKTFGSDKVNVAAIGNIVSQLHIHVIARYRSDIAWPSTVWSCTEQRPFVESEVARIRACYLATFG